MSFNENMVQHLLWNKHPEKMINAVKVMITMCKKYDLPFNYKDLGIIQDDKSDKDEDSMWNFTGLG